MKDELTQSCCAYVVIKKDYPISLETKFKGQNFSSPRSNRDRLRSLKIYPKLKNL